MLSLPPSLERLVRDRYEALAACCRAAGVAMHDDAGVGERLRRLLLASDFAFEALRAELARLRRFRRAEAVRLVFRDVNGLDEITDTLAGATDLYEVLIATALRWAEGAARARHGTPRNAAGAVQSLVVFALGKLGGGEL